MASIVSIPPFINRYLDRKVTIDCEIAIVQDYWELGEEVNPDAPDIANERDLDLPDWQRPLCA